MAHYRFSLFLLTYVACLAFVPSRNQDDHDRVLTGLYNQNPTSVSTTSGERGSFSNQFRLHQHDFIEIWGNTKTQRHKGREEKSIISRPLDLRSDAQRMLLVIAPVVAQEVSPKTQKPTPNQGKPTSNPKPQKPKSSNSRIPKSINSIIQVLNRQKVLFLLSLAAFLVTGASVFVLLKLLENGEGEYMKSKQAIAPKQTTPNHQPKNQKSRNNTFSQPNSEAISGLIFNPADLEFQPEALSPENDNNGYNETDLSCLEKINSAEQVVNNIPDVSVGETSHLSEINIIDQLIEDLANANPAQRHKAIWELGNRGDSRAVQPLVNLLLDSDSNQHSLILSSLSEIGIKTIKPINRAWVISLQNENPEVRKNAIRDLTRMCELVNQITNLLQRVKDDPDPQVQETARWALTLLNHD